MAVLDWVWQGQYSLNLVPQMYTIGAFDPLQVHTYPHLGPS